MEDNDKNYLIQNKVDLRGFKEYEERAIKLLKKIKRLKAIDSQNALEIKNYLNFANDMINKKELLVFNEIYEYETRILKYLKENIAEMKELEELPKIELEINELLKYKTLSKEDFDNQMKKINELKLQTFTKISNYVYPNLLEKYDEAIGRLKKINEEKPNIKEVSKKIMLQETIKEEKEKAISRMNSLIDDINELNKLLFENFKANDLEKPPTDNDCILMNELRKTNYFSSLNELLKPLKEKGLIKIPAIISDKKKMFEEIIKKEIKYEEIKSLKIDDENLKKDTETAETLIIKNLVNIGNFVKNINKARIDSKFLAEIKK